MKIAKGFKQEPYIKINALSAGIILTMLVYFGIFSSAGIAHPIPSMYSFSVPSTGMSRAFSSILRLNFESAKAFNPYGMHLFLFFFIQLFLRILFSIFLLYNSLSKKLLIICDIVVSLLLFLSTFGVYIIKQWNDFYV